MWKLLLDSSLFVVVASVGGKTVQAAESISVSFLSKLR